MLENENRTTLQRQRELLADETEIALLPPCRTTSSAATPSSPPISR